jgi:hypothetical protein
MSAFCRVSYLFFGNLELKREERFLHMVGDAETYSMSWG